MVESCPKLYRDPSELKAVEMEEEGGLLEGEVETDVPQNESRGKAVE